MKFRILLSHYKIMLLARAGINTLGGKRQDEDHVPRHVYMHAEKKVIPLFLASNGVICHVVHGGRSKLGRFQSAFIFTESYVIIVLYAYM